MYVSQVSAVPVAWSSRNATFPVHLTGYVRETFVTLRTNSCQKRGVLLDPVYTGCQPQKQSRQEKEKKKKTIQIHGAKRRGGKGKITEDEPILT